MKTRTRTTESPPRSPVVLNEKQQGRVVEIHFIDGRKYRLQHPGNRQNMRMVKDSLGDGQFDLVAFMDACFSFRCSNQRYLLEPLDGGHRPDLDNTTAAECDAWQAIFDALLAGTLEMNGEYIHKFKSPQVIAEGEAHNAGETLIVRMVDGREYRFQSPGNRARVDLQRRGLMQGGDQEAFLDYCFEHLVFPEGHAHEVNLDQLHPREVLVWLKCLHRFLGQRTRGSAAGSPVSKQPTAGSVGGDVSESGGSPSPDQEL